MSVPAEQSAGLDRLLTDAGVVSVVHDCVVAWGATSFPCTHDTLAHEVWAPTQAFLGSHL